MDDVTNRAAKHIALPAELEEQIKLQMCDFIEECFESMYTSERYAVTMVAMQALFGQAMLDKSPDMESPVMLQVIKTLKTWVTEKCYQATFEAHPKAYIVMCFAVFFDVYTEVLAQITPAMIDDVAAGKMPPSSILDGIATFKTAKTTPRKRPNTGRKAKNNQHHRRQ